METKATFQRLDHCSVAIPDRANPSPAVTITVMQNQAAMNQAAMNQAMMSQGSMSQAVMSRWQNWTGWSRAHRRVYGAADGLVA